MQNNSVCVCVCEGEREDGGSGPLTKGMNTREANNPITISPFTVLTVSYFLILTSDGLDVNFLSSWAVTSTEPHMAHGARKLKKFKKKMIPENTSCWVSCPNHNVACFFLPVSRKREYMIDYLCSGHTLGSAPVKMTSSLSFLFLKISQSVGRQNPKPMKQCRDTRE